MKETFRKEDHNRQDKARKSDYREDMKLTGLGPSKWSGASSPDLEKAGQHAAARQRELDTVRHFFFVYGKWLYQHTKKLSRFAELNANHTSPGDPELPSAFTECRRNWDHDYTLISKAIRNGRFRKVTATLKGLSCTLSLGERLHWDLPDGLRADGIYRKPPRDLRPASANLVPQRP